MKLLALSLSVCVLLIPAAMTGGPLANKTASYKGLNAQTGKYDERQGIIYQLPDPKRFGNGPFPLFIWAAPTFGSYRDILATTFVSQMANRGFAAASVEYDNWNTIQACPDYLARAQAIFDASRALSAVGVLCSKAGVSCSRGIVTAGMSQGGALAILARNYAPLVQAAFAMSISDQNHTGVGVNLPCLDDPGTDLPANRLTVVNGLHDSVFGGQVPLTNVSGFVCPDGSIQCWSPDGSGAGWYLIQDSQVVDGNADHCYVMNGDCSLAVFDTNWYLPSSFNWSLKPNLDWLASFGTSRNFSPSGM